MQYTYRKWQAIKLIDLGWGGVVVGNGCYSYHHDHLIIEKLLRSNLTSEVLSICPILFLLALVAPKNFEYGDSY